jgi:hypothetical protein
LPWCRLVPAPALSLMLCTAMPLLHQRQQEEQERVRTRGRTQHVGGFEIDARDEFGKRRAHN